MKIISLSENTTTRGFETEHGLSLYIEANNKKILFDFGASDLFCKNAKELGVDLSLVDFAVLSHGHNDHGGGLQDFLRINSRAPIYINPCALEPHYNATGKYIGLDNSIKGNSRLILVDDKLTVDRGITVFNCNSLSLVTPINNCGHTCLQDGVPTAEDYSHEQYMLIEDSDKRVLFSGCSHKGIINIMEWIHPSHLIGGFHFSKLPLGENLRESAKALDSYGAEYYTCHCTGTEQFEFMKCHMQGLNYLACGDEITI